MVWAHLPLLRPQQGGRRAGPPFFCKALQRLDLFLSLLFSKAAQPRGSSAAPFQDRPVFSSEPLLRTSLPSTCGLASGDHLPLDVAEHLSVAQEAAKVYVEHVAGGLQHDVVIVPVTDAQDVRGHAAAGTGVDEVLHSLRGRQADGRRGRKVAPRDCKGHGQTTQPALLFPSGAPTAPVTCQVSLHRAQRAPPHTQTPLSCLMGCKGMEGWCMFLHHFICHPSSSTPFLLLGRLTWKDSELIWEP